ncbi:MAG TPA: GTP cyclohydrolase I [Dehalococcoidia bacterium]|jgi:GTP cyclohydrolase I
MIVEPESWTETDYEELRRALEAHKRDITEEQLARFEAYAAEIFTTLGMDLDTPGTRETPRRFIRALVDSTNGYDGDPKLLKVFPTECKGGPACHSSQIIEGPIHFYALCEHHALPFFGHAWVGYIPHENIIGLSKLTRLVRVFGRRFTVQERIGREIADTIETMLQPHGVAVYMEANHLCTQMRGVEESSQVTRTTFWSGAYDESPSNRTDFFAGAGIGRWQT